MCAFLTDDDQKDSHEGQKWDVERAAERHAGDNEGDDEDEEANDHQSSHGLSPSWSATQTHTNSLELMGLLYMALKRDVALRFLL